MNMLGTSVFRKAAFAWYAAVAGGFASCEDTLSFTSDAGALLSFSADTVRFDTVISTVGSSTRRLTVYNRNADGLRVASVRLERGKDTPFRVNVDGSYLEPESGARAYDFEVRGGDSISVFAEVTMPESGQDAPVTMCDTLVFALESGVEQHVILTATGQDAYLWRAKAITSDTLLEGGRPVVVYDSLVVREGVTLRMAPGVKLYFHDGAGLLVYGRVVAEGTTDCPVVFRGDRTDRMFDYLPYDNTPSRWRGIRLKAASADNLLNHVDIHGGSYGIACDSSSTDVTKLTLENSVIHNVGGEGLGLYHCRVSVGNTQISNTLGHCVAVVGGWAEFVHCTLAQFYPWDASRGDALYISDKWLAMDYPLLHAHFLNCLVTGYAADVVAGDIEDGDKETDFYFGNCVLRTVEAKDDSARFVNVVYEKMVEEGGEDEGNGDEGERTGQGQFRLFDTEKFLYDFRLKETSVARGKGAPEGVARYPVDRYGVPRPEMPDAGCYEFVPDPEE